MSTLTDPTAGRPRRRGSRPRRLHALDGLRTIAVLLVVAYHARVPGLGGGFLGVDVFFVLSGFLITLLLLKELAHRGRVDLGRFWTRRVLRLAPASLLVIAVVLAWAMLFAPPFQRPSLGADALYSLLYLGNWRFISTSSYFADDGTLSPLQHVWSLALEEQFYLLWPLILTGVALVVLRRGTGTAPRDSAERAERTLARRRAVSTGALVVALGLSLASAVAFAALFSPLAPDRAYMGTDTKAFEPLVGAVAAALMLRPGVQAFVTRRAQPLMALGLAGIAVGVVLLRGEGAPAPAYFRGGGVAFALACAVLVAATSVADRRRGLTLVLGSTPVAYLGRISYGVYLWHWPLAVWILPPSGFSPLHAAAMVLGTVLLASASFHLVETPVRTGALARLRPARLLPAAASLSAVLVLTAAMLGGSPLNAIVPAVASGRAATGNVVLVGDSVVRRLAPALDRVASERGLRLTSAARGGCPVVAVTALDGAGRPLAQGRCATEVPAAQDEAVAQAQPDVVVWWSRYELADRIGPDGARLVAGTPAFWAAQRADLRAAADRLTATGATLVIVETDRTGRGIDSRCGPQDCDPFLRRLRDDDAVRVAWNDLVRDLARHDQRVRLVRMDDVYCRDDANPCDDTLQLPTGGGPLTATGAPAYARPDGSHFDASVADRVAATLLQRVVGAADLRAP